ncbi:AraC family transcriptional regulator [Pseudomaricurvus alkylphenolicus]|uniref:AraC family transcriptional regulator n=1 Tax=Pseudomaricurvus alkylphenolicus TaxID=1306991 RepID=UPI001420292C|nr:AraC family transcriptional regulator [Pseudomaricurvus alkylphenolicus]NIB43350.1 AraC family transcriptional regulator [Pseudomaricurvus alkylphenolicus]
MEVPNPNWSVYSTYVEAIVQAGEHLGAPVDALLIKVGIDKHLFKDPEHRFPVAKVLRFYQLLAEHTNNPDIGLYTGRIAHINGLNLQLYMSTVCSTFREYLNLMPSVLRFSGDIGEVVIQGEPEFIRLEWQPLWKATGTQRLLTDEMLTVSAAIVNSLCILPIPVRRAHFTYAQPQDLTLLNTTFGENLHFNQPVSCLYFSRESLNYPLTRLAGDLAATMARPVEHLFQEGETRDVFLQQLRQTILKLLPEGEISIDRVAEELNLSRRTLQRRLSDRDTQFLQVLQSVRASLALRYLADERLGITEIAFLLGYGDQGSFSSAFKSWHGMSPREYRQGQ